MSDLGPVQGANEPTDPAAARPRLMACPRCRGTFEGSPDSCPHCGLTKAQAGALNSQGVITPPTTTQPAAPHAAAPLPGAEPAGIDGPSPRKSPPRLLFLLLVLAVVAGGAAWWTLRDTGEEAADERCSSYEKELAEVQSRDYPNSREKRRAELEVLARAADDDCELENPANEASV